MIKIIGFLVLLIFLVHCSVDTKTGFWKDINNTSDTTTLSDFNFDYDKSYEQYKENIIQYGKIEDFPKLDK
tara:strand:- start:23 stop:235 length:213 start_codon:yes stop_codon:yes gene_type:complete